LEAKLECLTVMLYEKDDDDQDEDFVTLFHFVLRFLINFLTER